MAPEMSCTLERVNWAGELETRSGLAGCCVTRGRSRGREGTALRLFGYED